MDPKVLKLVSHGVLVSVFNLISKLRIKTSSAFCSFSFVLNTGWRESASAQWFTAVDLICLKRGYVMIKQYSEQGDEN